MIDQTILQSLNGKELQVYHYIEAHKQQVGYMRIRELAQATQVSTATIMRLVKKLGLDNYNAFKYWCKQQEIPTMDKLSHQDELIDCLQKFHAPYYEELFQEVAALISASPFVIFTGIGNSGGIAHYGARCFSNAGIYAICQDDPFYNAQCVKGEPVVIALSVSGETKELFQQISGYREAGCPIVCITTSQQGTLAKMADLVIAYHVQYRAAQPSTDFTSQIPAVHIIELLACCLHKTVG